LVDNVKAIKDVKEYVLAGNHYPKTYFWWDFTDDNSKYELFYIDNNKPRREVLKFIEKIVGLRNLPYQIDVLRKQREYDVIFSTLDSTFNLVNILRYLRILKKPIFGISHFSYNTKISQEKWYWKLRSRFFNYFTLNGLDYVAFWSEIILNRASEVNNLTVKNSHILRWGPDLSFYDDYTADGTFNDEPVFMSIGSSNRDYNLLIKLFSHLPYKLKIYQKFDDLNLDSVAIPENVEFNNELKEIQHLERFTYIRTAYKKSFAVLIALESQYDNSTGITCLFEAMACGIPVVVTDNVLFPIDVEKEGVGIKVAYGDEVGWNKAVNFLINNRDLAEKMGKKGHELIKTRHNYDIYKMDLLADFDKFIIENNVKRTK